MGPRNQGWKDSENAVVYEDGSLVDPPIAACELQGYYYAALQSAAAFSFLLGARRDAVAYVKKAMALKKRFNDDFWVDDEGYVGFGLDAEKRLIRGKTSNMGHCLAAGIIANDKVPSVVKALTAPDMLSAQGIRTLSADHHAYNPLSYHLGSVWPVENATIALGFRRYGYTWEALTLVEAAYRQAQLWHEGWTPECIGGHDRADPSHPGAYPKANAPQLWNGAAFGLFVQVMLGMQPMAPIKTLFVDPVLPEWLPEFTLHSLRIGDATVSIRFDRDGSGRTRYRVIEKTGTLHVLKQPPVNSLFSSIPERLLALLRSLGSL
jgi:glycogen debranching enzyme